VIPVNDLRQGTLFEHDGNIYQVLEFRRHKMARAKAVVNVKVRDIQTNNVRELSFKSGDSVDEANVNTTLLKFIYHDTRNKKLVFSHPDNNQRVVIDEQLVDANQRGYLVEGGQVTAMIEPVENNPQVYSIVLPNTVDLKVTQAPPSEKGDTASGGSKPVTVETGITVNTPLFIKTGDTIRVNTSTGEYIERVSQ